MELRKLINLFTEQTATQPAKPPAKPPAQGVTGQKIAQTSGGQFMNRADRTNQAKVDAALGPGFKAGSAAANQALAKKFSQPQPAATAPAPAPTATPTASAQQSAALDASKATAIGGQQAATPAATSTQTSDQIATAALNAQDSAPANNQSSGYSAQSQAQKSPEPTAPVNNQSSGYSAQSQAQKSPEPTPTAPAAAPTDNQSSGYSAQSQAQKSPEPAAPANNQSSGYSAQSQAQKSPEPAPAKQNTAAPASAGGYAQSATAATNDPAPKASNQKVAGSTNLVTRTPDQIAADNAKPFGAQQNQATKSYASFGDFASAVGDKVKGMFGGNKPAPAASQAPVNNQSSGMTAQSQAQKSPEPAPAAAPTQTSDQIATAALNAPAQDTSGASKGIPAGFGQMAEDELEEELNEAFNDLLRLSGIQLNEKAVSKQQQKFMGMVHAMQKGEKVKGASPELKKVAKSMGKKDARDFASTKHKGLPTRVNEDLNLRLDEEGHNLEHIVNRFKHETKRFLNGDELDNDLYEALYDYYADAGEMPYGVAKAREGDPFQWVSNRFESDLSNRGYDRNFNETVMPVVDQQLSELARLAGLSESRLGECGDMGMDMEDRLNVSTNMSSDGTKSVNISAQGEKAEELLSMLKLAGMGGSNRPSMVMIDRDEEMMDEGILGDRSYNRVMPIVKRIASEVSDYDRDEFGEEMWSLLDQKYGSKFAQAVLQDDLDFYWNEYTDLTGQGLDEDRPTEYANTPDEKIDNIETQFIGGDGEVAGKEKRMHAGGSARFSDNPLAVDEMLDEEWSALYDSILVKKDMEEGSIKGGDKPGDLTGTWSADPPKKGQPDIPPPVPMDPVYPAEKTKASTKSQSGNKR